MSEISIHLIDASRGDDEPAAYVYSNAIPRAGDHVTYWLDCPAHERDVGEPVRVAGKVARVAFEYRHMQGWGGTNKTVPMVLVYLDDYQAELAQGVGDG